MSTLKLHYDGWIALPAVLRQPLGLNSGDRVEADVIDGALVLWPATGTTAKRPRVAPAAPSEPSPPDGGAAAVPKRRGRPPKAQVAAQPRPANHAPVGIGPAKLIKKAELERNVVLQDDAPPAPVVRLRPERIAQTVERRPFRNVEIRPLGPGRGHNTSRRLRPDSGA